MINDINSSVSSSSPTKTSSSPTEIPARTRSKTSNGREVSSQPPSSPTSSLQRMRTNTGNLALKLQPFLSQSNSPPSPLSLPSPLILNDNQKKNGEKIITGLSRGMTEGSLIESKSSLTSQKGSPQLSKLKKEEPEVKNDLTKSVSRRHASQFSVSDIEQETKKQFEEEKKQKEEKQVLETSFSATDSKRSPSFSKKEASPFQTLRKMKSRVLEYFKEEENLPITISESKVSDLIGKKEKVYQLLIDHPLTETDKIINEIYQTEQAFQQSLAELNDAAKLLKDNPKFFDFLPTDKREAASKILSELFKDAYNIHLFSVTWINLLTAAKDEQNTLKNIAACFRASFNSFLTTGEKIKQFNDFRKDLGKKKTVFDEKTRELLQKDHPETFESLVLKMIQRLPRYQLFTQNLVKQTEDEQSIKYLTAAYSNLQGILNAMNEGVRNSILLVPETMSKELKNQQSLEDKNINDS